MSRKEFYESLKFTENGKYLKMSELKKITLKTDAS